MAHDLHIFSRVDLVTRGDGVRGLVAAVDALRAKVRWEDGRTEIIEQGEPSVWNEGTCRVWDKRDGWILDATGQDVVDDWKFWNAVGGRPAPAPESSDVDEDDLMEEAA